MGKSKLVRSLKTERLDVANVRKLSVLAEFRRMIRGAERAAGRRVDPLMEEAEAWRVALADDDGSPDSPIHYALSARLDAIEAALGVDKAGEVARVATSRETPISSIVEDWLVDRQMKPRQVLDYRRAVAKLTRWQAGAGRPQTIEGTTRRVASEYRLELVKAGTNPRTANKDLAALSSLWKFAERRGVALKENPWRGQAIGAKAAKMGAGSARKRPYTATELATLLNGAGPEHGLSDALRLLALTGMRTEELARLKVGDVRGGVIHLRGTKTAAARRLVPLHKDALPIVLRRTKGKDRDAFLFEELPTPPEGSAMERGQPWTKAFGRLRKRLGVTEREPGARQDNLDLHGVRRWAIATMRDALNKGAQGFTMRTVAALVGHKAEDMGLSMTARYAGEEPLEALRAAVESIRLP